MTNDLPLFNAPPSPRDGQLPDVTRRKHGGNEQSEDANRKVEPWKKQSCQDVEAFVRSAGRRGATSKEYAVFKGVGLNTISGRFSELWHARRIHAKDERRFGSGVWVHHDYYEGPK